jgi:hypothetical protein
MTKRLHVLTDRDDVVCVIFSDVAAVNAAHKRELIRLAHSAGLREPITLVSTSPLQSPLSLAKLGLRENTAPHATA